MRRYPHTRKIADLHSYVDAYYSYHSLNEETGQYDSGYTHVSCKLCSDANKAHTIRFKPLLSSTHEVRDAILPHLQEAHKAEKCSHCNSIVTKRGMKRHNSGMFCRAAQHKNKLLSEGKKYVAEYRVKGIQRFFTDLADQLVYGDENTPKDSRVTSLSAYERAKIYNEANLIAAHFEDIIGCTMEPTKFEAGGWGAKRRIITQYWISAEYERLLDLMPTYYWDHKTMDTVARYHAHPEERDAIICILEMQNESNNA